MRAFSFGNFLDYCLEKISESVILKAILVHIWCTNVNKMGNLSNKPFSAKFVNPHEI